MGLNPVGIASGMGLYALTRPQVMGKIAGRVGQVRGGLGKLSERMAAGTGSKTASYSRELVDDPNLTPEQVEFMVKAEEIKQAAAVKKSAEKRAKNLEKVQEKQPVKSIAEELGGMNKTQLKAKARELNVPGRSKMDPDQL
jgi:hypothetical protein